MKNSEILKKQECIPVGCVPSAAVAVSGGGGGCLLWGCVCSWRDLLQAGVCFQGGVCSWGMYAPGGGSVPRGVSALGGLLQGVYPTMH